MPGFDRDPRPQWRRTRYVRGAAGYKVEIDAISAKKQIKRESGKVGLSPAEYGRKCETLARAVLIARGYDAAKSHLSHGATDIYAVNATETLICQVKGASKPERLTAAIRACAKDMRGMQAGARRIGMIYLYRSGLVIELELTASGWRVTARQPYHDIGVKALAKTPTSYLERETRLQRNKRRGNSNARS